jgi:transposase
MERDGGGLSYILDKVFDAVEHVVTMGEPYLKVIREKCFEALHILDRFPIVAKMNKVLDEVRAGESRRMASEGRTPLLKKARWAGKYLDDWCQQTMRSRIEPMKKIARSLPQHRALTRQ